MNRYFYQCKNKRRLISYTMYIRKWIKYFHYIICLKVHLFPIGEKQHLRRKLTYVRGIFKENFWIKHLCGCGTSKANNMLQIIHFLNLRKAFLSFIFNAENYSFFTIFSKVFCFQILRMFTKCLLNLYRNIWLFYHIKNKIFRKWT